MKITEKQLELIIAEYSKIKDVDFHIYDDDSISTIRIKDLNYGKYLAYSTIFAILRIKIDNSK